MTNYKTKWARHFHADLAAQGQLQLSTTECNNTQIHRCRTNTRQTRTKKKQGTLNMSADTNPSNSKN